MERKLKRISERKAKGTMLFIDIKAIEDIMPFILNAENTLEYLKIQNALLANIHNKEIYQKVKNYDTIYEIRFTNKKSNMRIYCKQVSKSKKKYIILVKLYDKKTQKIPKEVHKILKQIENYEYNI